jgi:hypothetical protein
MELMLPHADTKRPAKVIGQTLNPAGRITGTYHDNP